MKLQIVTKVMDVTLLREVHRSLGFVCFQLNTDFLLDCLRVPT